MALADETHFRVKSVVQLNNSTISLAIMLLLVPSLAFLIDLQKFPPRNRFSTVHSNAPYVPFANPASQKTLSRYVTAHSF